MHDLINKVDRYASLLREEMQRKTASKGTYYRNPVVSYAKADGHAEAENDEVDISSAEVNIDKPFVCKGLVKADNSRTKIPDAKLATRETKAYTFELTRAEAIFNLLLSEKKFLVPQHQQLRCPARRHPKIDRREEAPVRAEHREERRPAKGKEPLAEPEPVLCSRCKYEIGRPRPLKNKRKATEPSPPTVRRFRGQYDRRPARGRVFDRLGAQNPSTSAGHGDGAIPRPLKTFKPPIIRDDCWHHAQPGGNVQPLTRTQLWRMQGQAQQAREQLPQAEGSKCQRKMATADESSNLQMAPSEGRGFERKGARFGRTKGHSPGENRRGYHRRLPRKKGPPFFRQQFILS
ncbi:unnamed protein product [Prunus brigantina]